jgi:hypothetical protein
MNSNDFEKKLREQSWQEIPGHWQKQILDAARLGEVQKEKTDWKERLGQFFWPHPKVWAALATVWVILLFANMSGEETSEVSPNSLVASPSFAEQLQLRAELLKPISVDYYEDWEVEPQGHNPRRLQFQMAFGREDLPLFNPHNQDKTTTT